MDERKTTKVTVAWPTEKGSDKPIEVQKFDVPLVLDEAKGRHVPDLQALSKKLQEQGFEKVVDVSRSYDINPLSSNNAIFVRGNDGKPIADEVGMTDKNGNPVMGKDGKQIMQKTYRKLNLDAYVISRGTYPGSTAYPGVKNKLTSLALAGDSKGIRDLYSQNKDQLGKSMGILADGKFYMNYYDENGKEHPIEALFPLSKYLENNLSDGARKHITGRDNTEKPSRYENVCSALGVENGVYRKVGFVYQYAEESIDKAIAPAAYAAFLAKVISEGESMESLATKKIGAPTLEEASNGYSIKGNNWLETILKNPKEAEAEVERVENRPVKIFFMFPKDIGKRPTPPGAVFLSMMEKDLNGPDGQPIPKIDNVSMYNGEYNEENSAYLARLGEVRSEQILFDIVNSAKSNNVVIVGYNNQNALCKRLVSCMDNNGVTEEQIMSSRGNSAIVACKDQMTPAQAQKMMDFLVDEKKHTTIVLPDIEQNENLVNAALSKKENGAKFDLVIQGMYASKFIKEPEFSRRIQATGAVFEPVAMVPTGRADEMDRFISGTISKGKGLTTIYDEDGRFSAKAKEKGISLVEAKIPDIEVEAEAGVEVQKAKQADKAMEIANNILGESSHENSMPNNMGPEQLVFGRPEGMDENERPFDF